MTSCYNRIRRIKNYGQWHIGKYGSLQDHTHRVLWWVNVSRYNNLGFGKSYGHSLTLKDYEQCFLTHMNLSFFSPSLSDLTLSISEARFADLLLLNDKICRFGRRQSVDSAKEYRALWLQWRQLLLSKRFTPLNVNFITSNWYIYGIH